MADKNNYYLFVNRQWRNYYDIHQSAKDILQRTKQEIRELEAQIDEINNKILNLSSEDSPLDTTITELQQLSSELPKTPICPPLVQTVADNNYSRPSLERNSVVSNPYIEDCKSRVSEGTHKKVNRKAEIVKFCKKFRPKTTRAKYELKKEGGQIVLQTSVYFKFKGEEGQKEESFARMEKVRQCVTEIFARNGIKLELDFQGDDPNDRIRTCDHKVKLHYSYKDKNNPNVRADANNWVSHESGGEPVNDFTLCDITGHELGHRLGLYDAYDYSGMMAGDECTKDHVLPRDSMMQKVQKPARNPLTTKIYPQNIKRLLEPLCGNNTPTRFNDGCW